MKFHNPFLICVIALAFFENPILALRRFQVEIPVFPYMYDQIGEKTDLVCKLVNNSTVSQLIDLKPINNGVAVHYVPQSSGANWEVKKYPASSPGRLGLVNHMGMSLAPSEQITFFWAARCATPAATAGHNGLACPGLVITGGLPYVLLIEASPDNGYLTGSCNLAYYPPGQLPTSVTSILINKGLPF